MFESVSANAKEPSVLCVIDFSESAENTLRSAIPLALKNQARLTILHPYRLNQTVKKEDQIKMKRSIEEDITLNFKKISHHLNELNVTFDFRSEVGFLIDRVQEHIRIGNVILLVMSKDLAVESREATIELIHLLDIPVVIVPKVKTFKT